jgi:hypothetical protein
MRGWRNMTIMVITAAIPKLARVKGHEAASRICRSIRLIINVRTIGRKIWTTTLLVAGLPVSPIRCTRKLRQR